MNIGIGLPSAVPGTGSDVLLQWARNAEHAGFSSLGVVDRVLYDAYEPMTLLAAAAAVTQSIQLCTMVVIGPLRTTAVLAKEAATVQALSAGRLVLGLSIGARADDYAVAGVPTTGRGERLSEQLVAIRDHWEDPRIGPAMPSAPVVLAGGLSDAATARVARHADGYVHGGGPPKTFARAAERVRAAWREAGRPGEPRLWAQGYFALGEGADVPGRAYMRDYYAFTGSFAEKIAAGLVTTPQALSEFVRGYAEAGCEELVLLPAVPGLDQIDRLAQTLAGLGAMPSAAGTR